MSKQPALGGGLFGNGLTGMDFYRPAVEPVPVPTQSPAPIHDEAWSVIIWRGAHEPFGLRVDGPFAAAFASPPVEGLCYVRNEAPVRCIYANAAARQAGFERVTGNVGGGMDRIVEVAY